MAICRDDFVSKSSTSTIMSIKNGIITTLTSRTIVLEMYEFNVAELSNLYYRLRLEMIY
jgi:hypothetical protein